MAGKKLKLISWELVDDKKLVKHLDYSSFHHNTSVIPLDFYKFFNLSDVKKEKIEINLINENNEKFNAYFRYSDSSRATPVHLIVWSKEFSNYLKLNFPSWERIEKGSKPKGLKLFFEKTISEFAFNVYTNENLKNVIPVVDSFVYPNNKLGKGSGESTLFIGPQKESTFKFWGQFGDVISINLLKQNLLNYYFEIKEEFNFPSQKYKNSLKMKLEFDKLYYYIIELSETSILKYEIYTGNTDESRVYLKPADKVSKELNNVLRKLSIDSFTEFQIEKFNQKNFKLLINNPKKIANENKNTQPKVSENIGDTLLPHLVERRLNTFVSNFKLVSDLKKLYNSCQFCDEEFEFYLDSNSKITRYSEAAHIQPKSEGGIDSLSNVLCLCANCHALFDLGTYYIDDNLIVRKSDRVLQSYEESYFNYLQLNENHKLDIKFIKYHRKLTKN